MAHVFYPPLPVPLPPHHATVYVAPNGQHFIPSPPPPQPRGPVILWDFDSTPVGSGDRTTAAINSLIGLCRGVAPHATVPMLQFCYTLKRYGYPGKEQVITEVRRHIPPYQLQVRGGNSLLPLICTGYIWLYLVENGSWDSVRLIDWYSGGSYGGNQPLPAVSVGYYSLAKMWPMRRRLFSIDLAMYCISSPDRWRLGPARIARICVPRCAGKSVSTSSSDRTACWSCWLVLGNLDGLPQSTLAWLIDWLIDLFVRSACSTHIATLDC